MTPSHPSVDTYSFFELRKEMTEVIDLSFPNATN